MAEVTRRRYGPDSTLAAKSPRADLYICDGGITQLRAARAVFAELGITDIPTVGLAERMEILVTDDERGDIFLPRDSQALFVATRLRDEAHRFAITHHRNLRERSIRESVLDDVPGIGEAKKVKLLKAFKSIYGIARASAQDVARAAGVGFVTAEAVVAAARSAAGEKGG
jgi:excinuclease ABC subunit C